MNRVVCCDRHESVLVVIDIQEKLLPKIPNAAQLVHNVKFLLQAARLLEVPVLVTEQYPKGLGHTVAELQPFLPSATIEKTNFSCWPVESFQEALQAVNRRQLVLVGIETHVCVLQTALQAVHERVCFLPVDAVGSRGATDADIALRRMEAAGAILTTTESVVFEWLGSSGHPQFKAISKLIIERSTPS